MIDLVAELRERLRLFARGGAMGAAGRRDAGPLDLAERLALTSRILAEGLEAQGGPDAVGFPDELRQLANAVERIPTPLGGSEVAAGLEELVQVMDDLACAWDRRRQADMPELWRRVREAGDQLWAGRPAVAAAPEVRPGDDRPVWLLIAGALRRNTLQHRVGEAGYSVVTLADDAAVMARLCSEKPAAVLCDDAAPGRYHHRLRSRWPEQSPPLVLVRAGNGRTIGTDLIWTPPYRPEDLRALLS